MKNIITLFFFVFMIYAKGFSQKKPTSASIKKPKLTIKKNPSTDKKPENNAIQALKNSTDSTVTVQIKKETVDTESLDALKAAEDFAKSQKDVRKFDRSTLSVLPVVLYLDTTRDSKRNLLVKTNIKKVYGDVLISEKHYFNHLQTDIEETFKDIFKDDMIERQFWGLAPKTVDNSERFSLLNPLAGIKSKYKKTKNSLTLNNLSNKIMKIGFGETYSYEPPTDTVGKAIKEYIENSDIPYNMLSVWKNKTTLITRAEFSIGELQKKTKVDVEKFENFKKLLQRNYLLVSAVNNPYKRTPDDAFYRANVSGFLYRILLNDNTITDILNNDFSAKTSMKLEYLGMVKIENLKLDPRSDEFIDRYNIKGGLFDVSVNGKNVQKYGGDGVAELFYKSIIAIFEETGRIADRYFKDGEYKCATMIYQQQIELSAKFPDIKMDVGNANLKLKDCREQLQKNATFNELKFQHAKNDERIARLELEKNQNAIIKMSDERRMALIHKLQPFFIVENAKNVILIYMTNTSFRSLLPMHLFKNWKGD
jgi:hypothetical protein